MEFAAAEILVVENSVELSAARDAAVVEMREERAARQTKRYAAVGIEQVGLIAVDQVADAVEPDLLEPRVLRVPAVLIGEDRLAAVVMIEVGEARVGAVV